MADLKMEELRKQIPENPEAEALIAREMRAFSIGEFQQLQQTENDLWNERPGTKLTENTKKLLEWYGGINKRVSEKILGKDARLGTQIAGTLTTGLIINTGVSLATFGTLTIPMRILGGAVSAERYKAGFEALAGGMREKRIQTKIQEGIEEAKRESDTIDLDKVDQFLSGQVDTVVDKFESYKKMRGLRTVGAVTAAVGISLASRTASEYTRGKLHDFANSETGSHMITKASETWSSIKGTAKEMFDVKNFVGSAEGADLKPAGQTPAEQISPDQKTLDTFKKFNESLDEKIRNLKKGNNYEPENVKTPNSAASEVPTTKPVTETPTTPKTTTVPEKPAPATHAETSSPKPAVTAEQIAAKQSALAGVEARLNDAHAARDAAERQWQDALKKSENDLRYKAIADRYKEIMREKQRVFDVIHTEKSELQAKLYLDKLELAKQQDALANKARLEEADKRLEEIRQKAGLANQPEQKASSTAPKGQEVMPTSPEEFRQASEKLSNKITNLYNDYAYTEKNKAWVSGENRATMDNMLKYIGKDITTTEAKLAYAQQQAGTLPDYPKLINDKTTVEELKFFGTKINFMMQAYESPDTSQLERGALANKLTGLAQATQTETDKRIIDVTQKVREGMDARAANAKFDEYRKIVNSIQDVLIKIKKTQNK